MRSRTFFLKLKQRRRQIIRTVFFFSLLRAFQGLSILGITYLLGWELQDVKDFDILGFRVYFLVMAIIFILILRRLYKIYRWWTSQSETIT